MLIVPSDLIKRIEENRGDLSHAEFISFLLDSYLQPGKDEQRFVTREDLQEMEHGIKELLRSFLDFFLSYGMELGHRAGPDQLEALSQRLQELSAPKAHELKRGAKG